MEVWNSWPDPECWVFRPGAGDEAQPSTLQQDFSSVEHILFVPRDASSPAAPAAAPLPMPPAPALKVCVL